MLDILVRAGCFVSIILLGYVLRRVGFFHQDDFKVLSKIVIRITLPAAIISSSAGREIEVSMLAIVLLGLGGGLIYMALGILLNRKNSKEQKAFDVLNFPGYNIGNFTMPFVQSFLGPMGVITTSLFDTGNAFVCLGGAHSVAAMIKEGSKLSWKRIGKSLIKSIPFDCYVIMTILNLARIKLPSPIVSLAEIVGGANAFLAMLMIGVGFKLAGDKNQIGRIVRHLTVRYGVAAILAVVFYFCLPFALEIRQALMILVFSPIASAAPAFTGDINGDVGLSSAVNSISIIMSIVFIVSILLVTQ